MKKLQSSLGAKFAAVILLTLSAVIAALAGIDLILAREWNVADEKASYYTSPLCESEAQSRAWTVLDVYENSGAGTEMENALQSDNYDYALRLDGTSGSLADTIRADRNYGFRETVAISFGQYDETKKSYEENYRVEIAVADPPTSQNGPFYQNYQLYEKVSALYPAAVPALIGSLLIFLTCCVYLAWAAGHKAGVGGIHLNWQDKMPLDLYLVLDGLAIYLLAGFALENCFRQFDPVSNVLGAVMVVAGGLLVLAAVMTVIARCKAGKWWRNTVICRLLCLLGRGVRALPMVWRTFLIVGGVLFLDFLFGVGTPNSGVFLLLAFLMDAAALIGACRGAMQMRALKKAGEALAAGNLEYKTETDRLRWDFKEHAQNLNAVSDGMRAAVNESMKAERLQTELITNVSHDIKTPLTSIVNYVDLLQKPHTEEENAQYLDVLARQSARLRKLTEDLVEASKASTGNLSVELAPTDLTELLNQSLGEYEQRMEDGKLTPVYSAGEEKLTVLADGKRLWRVLDNLLGNVCKYAMAGTRVYVTAAREGKYALVAVRNISREPLNISADELIERFIRGDASRTTEGSGLGLNIARSLMELQGGSLSLAIDGDLFRAEIRIPLAQEKAENS